MNQLEREMFGLLDMTHKVGDLALVQITGEDLAFSLPGCPALGQLLMDIGDVEWAYTQSFKTYTLDFAERAPGRDRVISGASAVEWLQTLDQQLKEAVAALSDEDLTGRQVERGGWQMPVVANFHTYREALLISFGKLDCHLKALGKDLPKEWIAWVG